METLRVKVVTPKGSLVDEEAASFTANSPLGQFCILPNHRPIMTALVTGPMMTGSSTGEDMAYALDQGFLEAGGDHVNVITENCVPADKIDAEVLKAELEEIEKQLKDMDLGTPEAEELLQKLEWAQVRLDVAK